jgi:predicted DCC family thiol-disulfide oxidoreductase YuxK
VTRERPSPDHVLIFDGDCRFCGRCIALLGRWDRRGRLRFVPFQDARALATLPPIPHQRLEEAMHLVTPDARVWPGADAVPPMLKVLPGGRLVSWIFAVPGVPRLAAAIYRMVARNRHRLGCGSATCTLGRH